MLHFGPRASDAFDVIRRNLRATRVRLGAMETALQEEHKDWQLGLDARLTSFAKLANVVESAELALKFQAEYLSDALWWQANYVPRPSTRDTAIFITEFSQFAKTGFLQLCFGALESSLRIFLRTIDPEACGGGTAEFKSVYECLIRSKLRLQAAADRVALLDLLRNLRNSIHNHGVIFSRSSGDTYVVYRGTQYDFAHATSIGFATWLLLVGLVCDAADLLDEIVRAPEIAGIAAPIVDPAAAPGDRSQTATTDEREL